MLGPLIRFPYIHISNVCQLQHCLITRTLIVAFLHALLQHLQISSLSLADPPLASLQRCDELRIGWRLTCPQQ